MVKCLNKNQQYNSKIQINTFSGATLTMKWSWPPRFNTNFRFMLFQNRFFQLRVGSPKQHKI